MVVYIYFYRTELQTDQGKASLENDAFTISIPYISYIFFKLHCRAPYSRIFLFVRESVARIKIQYSIINRKELVTEDMYVSFLFFGSSFGKSS